MAHWPAHKEECGARPPPTNNERAAAAAAAAKSTVPSAPAPPSPSAAGPSRERPLAGAAGAPMIAGDATRNKVGPPRISELKRKNDELTIENEALRRRVRHLELQLEHRDDPTKWISGDIHVDVATSLVDDEPMRINLSETIGHGRAAPRAGKRDDGNCYWLPRRFNQNTSEFRRGELHPMFVRACHAAGFLVHAEWNGAGGCIQFRCLFSKCNDVERQRLDKEKRPRNVRDPTRPPVPRNRPSARHSKGDGADLCTFKFRLSWDEPRRRWFLPRRQAGCLGHRGHERRDPSQLRMRSAHAPAEMLTWHQAHYLKLKKKRELANGGAVGAGADGADVDDPVADNSVCDGDVE